MTPRAVLVGLALAASGCGLREEREAKFHTLRLERATADYEAASGNLGRCVAAKMVALAYADLGNTADAGAWRARETADCQAARAELGPVRDLDADQATASESSTR